MHLQEMVAALDARVDELLRVQVNDPADARNGGFLLEPFHVESRSVGFCLSALICSYLTPLSHHHLSDAVKAAAFAALSYLERFQRPDGCFDLTPCNFASPPDTAFMLNAVLNAWWLAEKRPEGEPFKAPLERLLTTGANGVAAGGFHTPNHRWAIAACLLSCERAFHNPAWGERARQYLAEGLDVNEDGEFAERSAGNYNQVNDDQMIRLFLATGDDAFLRAAEKNLDMMFCYFDPDGSVFTNNSTRQDMGQKVYAESYYILYLLVGYLRKRPDFGAMAEWIYQSCAARGVCPPGVEWLLLFPDMDGYGANAPFDRPFERYARVFEESHIARVRRGDWSYTLLRGKPNFLYFQHGAFSLYMAVYANLCDRRNITPQTLRQTEGGFRMTDHAAGWYYLPFPTPPPTSDWWKMDHQSRPKAEGLPLDTTLDIRELADGIELTLSTCGVDRLPLREELGLLPGGYVRTEHFVTDAAAGGSVLALDGTVEAVGPGGEAVAIGPAFGEHFVKNRMGGAYPLSPNHFTVFFTGYTSVQKRFSFCSVSEKRRL